MQPGSLIWVGLFLIGCLLFFCYSKTGRFLRCLFFTAITGIGGLGLVWFAGRFVSLQLAITPLTIGVSALLGVPGVVGMLLLNLI